MPSLSIAVADKPWLAPLVRFCSSAIFLGSLSDAVDARSVSVTNGLLSSEELRFAVQMRTAWNVIDLVIAILGYRNRLQNLVRIGFAHRSLLVARRHNQLPDGKRRQSQWHGRSGG